MFFGYLLILYYDEVKFEIVSTIDLEKGTLSYIMANGKTKTEIFTSYTTARMHKLATIMVLDKSYFYVYLRKVELPYYTLISHIQDCARLATTSEW